MSEHRLFIRDTIFERLEASGSSPVFYRCVLVLDQVTIEVNDRSGFRNAYLETLEKLKTWSDLQAS